MQSNSAVTCKTRSIGRFHSAATLVVAAFLSLFVSFTRGQATGGVLTQNGSTYTHVFTSSGTFTVPTGGLAGAKVLIVAGGGGGGSGGSWSGGGGGGGGGVVYLINQTIGAGTYQISVGAGGSGGPGSGVGNGGTGGNSAAFGTTAFGGGGGGGYTLAGIAGGCGGGAGRDSGAGGGSGTQGGYGGSAPGTSWEAAGGGGGAGGNGFDGTTDQVARTGTYSQGGIGIACSITGTSTYYAGGGAGAWQTGGGPAPAGGAGGGGTGSVGQTYGGNGVNGLGGGGGGGQAGSGGNGGSGIVIISYVLSPPTVTIVGGNNQSGYPSQFNSSPFDVAVWNSAGTAPLVGISITFTVQSGGGLLATTNTGSPTLSSSLTLTTDADGTAQAYYQQPGTANLTSQITAASGGAQVTFTTQSVSPVSPPSAPAWAQTATSGPAGINFSWGASTPAAGGYAIAGYYIYRNGTQLNSSAQLSTSYSDTTVTGGTAYTYAIKAVDSAGNLSSAATLNVSAPTLSTSGTFDVYTPTP